MIDGPQDWTRPRRAWCFAGIVVAALGLGTAAKAIAAVRIVDDGLHLASPYFDIRLSLGQPGFAALVFDGLGEAKPGPNALRPPAGNDVYRATRGVQDGRAWVEYRREGTAAEAPPGWRFEIGDSRLRLISEWSPAEKPRPLVFNFDPERCHVTLLGLMDDDGSVRLPAVLHFPNQGSLRITTTARKPVLLGYDARRGEPLASAELNFVKITFPAASHSRPRLEYRCQITAISPPLGKHEKAPELHGFQRNWLNGLQLSPRWRRLANNSTSDVCAVCMYEYADIAAHTPPLADRLTALDLVRQTLDRYLAAHRPMACRAIRT